MRTIAARVSDSNGPTELLGIRGGRVGRRSYIFCTTSETKIHAIALHDDSSLHAGLFRLSDSTCRSRFLVEALKRGIFRRGEGMSVLRLPHTRTSDTGPFGAWLSSAVPAGNQGISTYAQLHIALLEISHLEPRGGCSCALW